ncbi:Calx-beta domain-containing protein [Actinoplanes sp. NPDC004185]
MRYSPAHAAKSGSVPFMLRGPKSVRTVMAAAVAGIVGLVPTVLIASPAHAVAGGLTITTAAKTEGNNVRFTITRTGGGVGTRDLSWSTVDDASADHPAKAGEDYTSKSGTISIAAADTAPHYIDVPTSSDTLDEFEETFKIVVTEGGNPAVFDTGDPAGLIGTINDDSNDVPPSYTLTASPTTVTEPSSATPAKSTITARLSAKSGKPVTIDLTTDDITAEAGVDYNSLTDTLTIPAGEMEDTAIVEVLKDDLDDSDENETFSVDGDGTNVAPAKRSTTVTIADRDATPKVTLGGGGNVDEGDDVTFTVSLDKPSERTVTVHWDAVAADPVTNHGAATPADDFTSYPDSASRTVTFVPGDASESIVIPVKADDLDELNPEDFAIQLSAPDNATLGSIVKVAAQISDAPGDDAPAVSITPTEVDEGDSGTTNKKFTATLSEKSGQTVKVRVSSVIDGVAGVGVALPGRDFVAKSEVLTFPAGTTTQDFTVGVIGDTVDEGDDETFNINLTDVDGTADVSASPVEIEITDDDDPPTFSVADLVFTEGDDATAALMPIKLSSASEHEIRFDVTDDPTGSDTATEAQEAWWGSNDYDTPPSPVVIPAGQTTGYALVYVNGDEVYEGNETTHFEVAVTAGTSTYISGADTKTPKLTLTNDDVAPQLEINSDTGEEGDTLDVTGTITGIAEDNVNLNITFAGGSSKGSNAAEPDDFTNPGAKGYTILGGTAPGTVVTVAQIALTQDTAAEPAETIIGTGIGLGNVGSVKEGIITIAASDGGTDPGAEAPTLGTTTPVRLGRGRVVLSGKATAGQAVDLWGKNVNASGYAKITSTTAGSDGMFSFSVGLNTYGMDFKAAVGSKQSDPVRVLVREDPDISVVSNAKGSVTVTVTGDPKVAGLTAKVLQAKTGGGWITAATGKLSSAGTYTRTITGLTSGKSYTFKAQVLGNTERGVAGNYSAYSKNVKVK